jgi:serine/threonine protein phosphatase PrpC
MSSFEIESGAATHIGRRSNNEDAWSAEPGLGFFAVADGLGGHEGGEVASQLVVRTMTDFLASRKQAGQGRASSSSGEAGGAAEDLLVKAVREAHRAVLGQQRGHLSLMASTLTSVLLEEDSAVVCNLGDSRTYLLRDGEVRALTRDHTVLAELAEAGMDPSNPFAAMHRNSLTGAVGMEASVAAECQRVPLRPGDSLLLCSDGLYEPLEAARMAELLNQGASAPAREVVERLVSEALRRGGSDNITGVLVRSPPPQGACCSQARVKSKRMTTESPTLRVPNISVGGLTPQSVMRSR